MRHAITDSIVFKLVVAVCIVASGVIGCDRFFGVAGSVSDCETGAPIGDAGQPPAASDGEEAAPFNAIAEKLDRWLTNGAI